MGFQALWCSHWEPSAAEWSFSPLWLCVCPQIESREKMKNCCGRDFQAVPVRSSWFWSCCNNWRDQQSSCSSWFKWVFWWADLTKRKRRDWGTNLNANEGKILIPNLITTLLHVNSRIIWAKRCYFFSLSWGGFLLLFLYSYSIVH